MLDHLSLGLAGLAALLIALLTEAQWMGVVLGLALLFAALAVWWASLRRAARQQAQWHAHLEAQGRLAELLMPIWQEQVQMAGQHCALATEAMANRLASVVMQIGTPLPQQAYAEGGDSRASWQAEHDMILADIRDCTLHLQFQDRVDQILAHVHHNISACREGLVEICRRFEATGESQPLDVDRLLNLLEASYATEEERVVHQGHLALSEMPRRATASADAAITYF